MGGIRVDSFTISVDGFGAGPGQDLANPMGLGAGALHRWAFGTRTFRQALGFEGGAVDGVDEGFAARGFQNIGAWIMGRNMFGPVRGPWPDLSWRGWWGENPPYHVPVFVLTHHPRAPLVMAGDNTFHFVTEGFDVALRLARAAAGDRDVRIGGGVQTIRSGLVAGAIDEMHVAVSPILLGRGEALWAGLDLRALGYDVAEVTQGEAASHLVIQRSP